jgi:hypothetical protein
VIPYVRAAATIVGQRLYVSQLSAKGKDAGSMATNKRSIATLLGVVDGYRCQIIQVSGGK